MVRSLSIIVSVVMVLALMTPSFSFAQNQGVSKALNDSAKTAEAKFSDRLKTEFEEDDNITFLVKFNEKADVMQVAEEAQAKASENNLSALNAEYTQRSAVISELKYVSKSSQQNVKAFLEQEIENGTVEDYHSYHIVNGMAVTAPKEIAERIASFPEVEKLLPNEERQLNEVTVDTEAEEVESEIANVEWNIEQVHAPEVWDMGIDGAGIVVGAIDTGVEWDHPALKDQYRGYDSATDEVDHQYSFFDPVGGQSDAYDDQGHGTHVAGTMVGAEPDGSNQVGVAPGAKHIAAKAFDASGGGNDANILAAGEWMLAPGDDVTKAPDVVNNSWGGGPGLDEWYRDVVTSWRAAGIFPEFSAGNTTLTNPGGPGSIAVPANYPESFATGATDSDNNLASFSLEGPSPYDEVKPEIVAPGVNIRSAVPGGGYEGGWDGTSMAGPATSGLVALLLQANADLSVDELEDIIMDTATPLTNDDYPETPNNGFGHGLINAYDAVSAVADGLGTIEGHVSMEGEDTEPPTFEHEVPAEEAFTDMDLDLTIQASDDIAVTSVSVDYTNADGDTNTVEASQQSGNHLSGEYLATIPGEDLAEGDLTYTITVTDFGENEVTSDEYSISIVGGITVGYSTDFETDPIGWDVFGENVSWEHGEPTSGPGEADSGDNVYATNLSGDYNNSENSTLTMPPIDLPEGESYLQLQHWYDIESGWDYGHVFISTDMEDWTELLELTGSNDGWEAAEVDLSDYAGERVYIGFNMTTDSIITYPGWYIDNVALSDESLELSRDSSSSLNSPDIDVDERDGEPMDPSEIQPKMTKESNSVIEEETSLLPLDAQVSVVESGRSATTSPVDGSYSLVHPAGEFTILAEAYGFYSEEQSIDLEADETVSANFVLEELPEAALNGTVTSSNSGEPIEGATLQLIEDANVDPVETDANGQYELTAYEGDYTLRIFASDYSSKEVEVSLDQDQELNLELEPLFTYPGGEIGYDDGTAENARAFFDPGNKWAVRMSLPEDKDSAIVTDGVFQFHDDDWPEPGGTEFAVEVWEAHSDGMPGEKIAGPVDAEATRSLDEWTVVDLREHNIQVEGDFYMVYVQTNDNTSSPGLATDEDGPYAERSYQSVDGTWSQSPADEGNYMIRSRVAYEVEQAEITSPSEHFYTNESEMTVEGNASPTTTVSLENNGDEVGQMEVEDDGTFSFDLELSEGDNELTAVTYVNDEEANQSESVAVTLDTEAPHLTIDNLEDGDKLNTETVTVEGEVTDENLDTVTVNGNESSVEDGAYSERIMLDEGENQIEVHATDKAGNESTESITVEVDFTAPEIENVTPTEDKTVEAGQTVMITFDSEPGLDATFRMHMPLTNTQNATELPMQETEEGHYVGYWTAPQGLEAEGAVVEVIAVDDFGNESRAEAEGKVTIVTDEDPHPGNPGNGNGPGIPGGPDNGNGPPGNPGGPGNGNGPGDNNGNGPGSNNGKGNN
ncbi:S8 family serine peptidase [Alkalibacillus silvisoli]|uniref:Bacillopeptidase F n=1 Tax=Alkalibacillus silvisoli TaxID=392823 RepID=A0ABP3JE16_9BACI